MSLPTPLPTKTAGSVCASSPSKQSTWTKILTCKLSPFTSPPPAYPSTNTRLQLQEPCRLLRMPSLSHRPPKRRLLPRPHPRPQASNQSRPSSRTRSQRRPQSRPYNRSATGNDWATTHSTAKKPHQDRPAWLQNNEAPRPCHAAARAVVPVAIP